MIYRHGDIGITALKEIPSKLKSVFRGSEYILAYGEATGHNHKLTALKENTFEILKDLEGKLYLDLKEPADLTHQEHKTITIEPGFYFVGQEKEYDYFQDEIRQVRD